MVHRGLLFIALLAAGLCSSCTSPKNLTRDSLGSSGITTLHAVHHETKFNFITLDEADALGIAMDTADQGDTFEVEYNLEGSDLGLLELFEIETPAVQIKTALAKELAETYGIEQVIVHSQALPRNINTPSEIRKHIGADGYILSVYPGEWQVSYLPEDWKHYSMRYGVKVRIFNSETGETLFYNKVKASDAERTPPPTRKELLANHAAVFKTIKRDLAHQCLAQLRPGLDLPPAPTTTQN
jgi:hypothetical protein